MIILTVLSWVAKIIIVACVFQIFADYLKRNEEI